MIEYITCGLAAAAAAASGYACLRSVDAAAFSQSADVTALNARDYAEKASDNIAELRSELAAALRELPKRRTRKPKPAPAPADPTVTPVSK